MGNAIQHVSKDEFDKIKGTTNTGASEQTGSGFGGYSPNENVTNVIGSLYDGSFRNNPYAQQEPKMTQEQWMQDKGYNWVTDWANVAPEWEQYSNDYDENIRKSEEWDKEMENYKGQEAFKYIADKAKEYNLSDDDMAYLFRLLDNDSRFSEEDALGNKLTPSEEYFRFMMGDKLDDPDANGNPVYTGGYRATLAEKEAENADTDSVNEDQQIYDEARQVYANKVRNYRGIYEQKMAENPELTWDGFNGFLNDMLLADNEFSTAKDAMETAAAELEKAESETMTVDKAIQNALDAAMSSQMPKVSQNKAEYDAASQMYANFDFSSNPFKENSHKAQEREDYKAYEAADLRARYEGIMPGSPEYAETVKKYFLLSRSGYSPKEVE